jgi:hypothetical protein
VQLCGSGFLNWQITCCVLCTAFFICSLRIRPASSAVSDSSSLMLILAMKWTPPTFPPTKTTGSRWILHLFRRRWTQDFCVPMSPQEVWRWRAGRNTPSKCPSFSPTTSVSNCTECELATPLGCYRLSRFKPSNYRFVLLSMGLEYGATSNNKNRRPRHDCPIP